MKTVARWLSLSLLVALTCLPARAAPPQTISYQGFLTTSAGVPVSGTVTVQFALYGVTSGGTPLWTESQSVTVTNGNYSVILGNTTPLGLAFDIPYFLGVTVGTDPEMAPRAALTMVPYAFRAIIADSISASATVAGSQVTGQIAPNQISSGTAAIDISGIAAAAVGFTGALAGDVTGLQGSTQVERIRGTNVDSTPPTANQFLGYDGSKWAPMNVSGSQITGTIAGSQITGAIATSATISGSQITGTIAGVAPWVTVSSSQPAVSNTAYLAIASSLVTITLPASPAAGDIVKVSGQGAGGFTIAASAGQTILGGQFVPGGTWIARDTIRSWSSVASSSDGIKLVAANSYDPAGSYLYTSINSGVTWDPQPPNAYPSSWQSVASSSDGSKVVAVVNGGGIYRGTLTDSTWTWNTTSAPSGSWQSVASSADGGTLVALLNYDQIYQIYTSLDSGGTWVGHSVGDIPPYWASVASSSDGTKVVAVASGGGIYRGTLSSGTWAWGLTSAPSTSWQSVASSSDGTKLVAVATNEGGDRIYTSNDSGGTWTPRESIRNWKAVASSSDGTKLVAAVNNGQIYTSTDSGVTWTPRESIKYWYAIASSSDGTKLVAAVSNGQIYTSAPATTITGGQYSAAELVYGGSGQWLLVSQNGTLTTP